MTRIAFAIPGDLQTATGGYAYDRRVIAELRDLGHRVDVIGLGARFPDPDAIDRGAVAVALDAIPDGTPTLVDGLALGILPEDAARLTARLPLVGLVHHPLALETALAPAMRDRLLASERQALKAVHRIVVTSPATARTLQTQFDVAADRITVAVPGVDRPPAFVRGDAAGGPVRLLAVGALVPRKGYDVLIGALATLTDLDWRLEIVGDERDPKTANDLRAQLSAFGLGGRVTLAGRLADAALGAAYRRADVFVLPSRYEGYGMVASEALAHGLPLVSTDAGALAETVPDAAALKAPADDAEALAAALRRVIGDPPLRARLGAGAREAAGRLPTWRACAMTIETAIEDLIR